MLNFVIIIYVQNKNLVIRQINKLIKEKIVNLTFVILLDTYEYIHLFSKYGTVIICGNEIYLSKKMQLAYKHIKEISNYEYVLEINSGFIIDSDYIAKSKECFESNDFDIIVSKNYLTYNLTTKELYLNYTKIYDTNTQINIYCRCVRKSFLEKINYKIFDFNKNDNVYELSHTFCILNSANIKLLTNFSVYKIVNTLQYNTQHNTNICTSKILSNLIISKVNQMMNDNINVFFNKIGIKQIYVSKDLSFFKQKIQKIYNLVDISNPSESALFFGMYNISDYSELIEHQGAKYIIWGGSDIDLRFSASSQIVPKVAKLKGVSHFAISKSVYLRLEDQGIKSTLINFSLVDQNIFNPSNIDYSITQPKTIYIYNGNKTSNPLIYNQELVNKIVEKLSGKYEFIFSSDINIPNNRMTEIYSQCFMGIRLCQNDGNANTVQEMGLLGLPVLHNGLLPNSVQWTLGPDESVDLLCEKIDYIYKNFWKLRDVISDSVLKYLSEDNRENICVFVPMWYRHETTEKNIHLLTNQIYSKTKIILIYSNVEDQIFAKRLEIKYPNLYSIDVANRPLSKKFQFGAEYCKIFYPRGIVINGSDDFLSLNYTKCVAEEFSSESTNYLGCNFWYVGDLASMLLYKFKYKDTKRVVGCGRAFKYDLLDDVGWQIFPLDRNSGIDGASKEMIKDKAVFKALDLPKCFTFSFKEKTDMITPMSNLLKSEHNTHNVISDRGLLKIMYSTNLYELETTFRFQETSLSVNLYLFVTLLDNELKRSNPIMLNSYYMERVLEPYFDIIDIRNLSNLKVFNYKLIFIDGIALNTRTSKLDKSMLYTQLNKIKNIPKVLLAHDIHDYSFDFDMNCQPPKEMLSRELIPVKTLTSQKSDFLQFIKQNNIQNIISVCDCEEFDLMTKYYSTQIKKFFILSHHIPQEIFYPRVKSESKKYHILIYGWSNSDIVYPFRTRLKKLIVNTWGLENSNSKYLVRVIERTSDINKIPIENDLAELISQSWICITCISNFSYLVRKYFEIAACGSVICGNINLQGKSIFQNNIIELEQSMSDYEILRIIDYYLSNPDLLLYMSSQIKSIALSYNYNMFIKKILEIKDNVVNQIESDFEYSVVKKHLSSIDPVIKIHNFINIESSNLSMWKPNQKVFVNKLDSKYIVKLEQSISTPGIKTNLYLESGKYLLSFDYMSDDNLTCSIFCFSTDVGSKTTQINVHEEIVSSSWTLICGNFNIEKNSNYTLYILITNPSENKFFTVENIKLKKLNLVNLTNKFNGIGQIKDLAFYNKIVYGSISCVGELEKLHNTFGGYMLAKDDILKKTWLNKKFINQPNYLILLGLYSPHHWERIYKPLFDKFERVMIIFTGTDILQLSDKKILNDLRQVIYTELSSPKYILGALNQRNLTEIKQIHNLDCKIISLPVRMDLNTYNLKLLDQEKTKSIACYLGENLEWYCHPTLIQIARLLPDYKFYLYKYGGFSQEFITKSENSGPNIIYNNETIYDFKNFMEDKFCSLRITLHDGEPMTGIETMILSKPFIFNHQMDYCVQIPSVCNTNPEEIVKIIENTWADYKLNNQVSEYYLERNSNRVSEYYLERNSNKVSEYYLERNSNRVFEKNLFGYFTLGQKCVKIFESNSILNIPTNFISKSEYMWKYQLVLNPGTYSFQLNGKTDGYGFVDIITNSNPTIVVISSKYSQIAKFETLSWIEFKLTSKITMQLCLKLCYPQLDENIQIRSLSLYTS